MLFYLHEMFWPPRPLNGQRARIKSQQPVLFQDTEGTIEENCHRPGSNYPLVITYGIGCLSPRVRTAFINTTCKNGVREAKCSVVRLF